MKSKLMHVHHVLLIIKTSRVAFQLERLFQFMHIIVPENSLLLPTSMKPSHHEEPFSRVFFPTIFNFYVNANARSSSLIELT